MKNPKTKVCDCCGEIVATKEWLWFYTNQEYITLKLDKSPSYTPNIYSVRTKAHLCRDCFDDFADHIMGRIPETEPKPKIPKNRGG